MIQPSDPFWAALHERWQADDRSRERNVIRSVLWHLACRLPGPETRHIQDQLPEEFRDAWPVPEPRPVSGEQRRVEKIDYDEFVAEVQDEAGLPSRSEAEAATAAVFHALGRVVSAEERNHVASQLPKGLKRVWVQEAT